MSVFKHNNDRYATNDFAGLFEYIDGKNKIWINEKGKNKRFNNIVIVV
jgi:hypothetical protein